MGYFDECTLGGQGGVFGAQERNQRGVSHTQHYRSILLGTVVFISHSLLATDKSHHPESLVKLGGSGGRQELKMALF